MLSLSQQAVDSITTLARKLASQGWNRRGIVNCIVSTLKVEASRSSSELFNSLNDVDSKRLVSIINLALPLDLCHKTLK